MECFGGCFTASANARSSQSGLECLFRVDKKRSAMALQPGEKA